MSSRGERRRKERASGGIDPGGPPFGRTELIVAAVVIVGVIVAAALVILLSGGNGDSGEQPLASGGSFGTGAPFVPQTDDDRAVLALAERSVNVLPRDEWDTLYDEFTPEFQSRCSREAFEQVGIDAAQALGAQLSGISFKELQDVTISGEGAQGVIVGLSGAAEYTIEIHFQKADGVWKIAPAPATTGCTAFNRLSG